MSTLLDEILRGVFISGTVTGRSCATHKQGCNCSSCNKKIYNATGGHKNWKERRKERLQGAAKPAARGGRSSAVQREQEWEAPPAKPVKPNPQVVLVAGHDYDRKGVNFAQFCENRYKRLLTKNRNLRCTLFNVSTGEVKYGVMVRGKVQWTVVMQYHAVDNRAHYAGGGHAFTGGGASGVISITDVYQYVRGIGTSNPGTLKELSFFSHGFYDGPVLVNSNDRNAGRKPRDADDKDGRGYKDFLSPNMSATDLANFKSAFASDGYCWVWGCVFTDMYRQVLHKLLKNSKYTSRRKIADTATFTISLSATQMARFAPNDRIFFPTAGAGGIYPTSFTRTFAQIKDYFQRGMSGTYAGFLAPASGVPCRAGLPGTYSDYDPAKSYLPLMRVPKGEKQYKGIDFRSYIRFYTVHLGMKEDPEKRGYGIFNP